MISRIHFLLFCFIPLATYSQNFAPDGAEWHYTPWYEDYFINEVYYHFAINAATGDSIEGLPCRTLYWSDADGIDASAEIQICENNGTVYFYEDAALKLLYDFNLTINDTLIFNVPSVQQYYDLTCCSDLEALKQARVIITDVSDTVIDGVTLQTQKTIPIYSDEGSAEYFVWELGTIIEKIGSLNGLFGSGPTCCLAGIAGTIRCYTDMDLFAKFVEYDCVFLGVNDQFLKPILFSPTLTSGEINIYLQGGIIPDEILIFNINGAIVFNSAFYNLIDISNLHPGIYFIEAKKDGVILQNEKIIKIRN